MYTGRSYSPMNEDGMRNRARSLAYPKSRKQEVLDERRGIMRPKSTDTTVSDALKRLIGSGDNTQAAAPLQGLGDIQSKELQYPDTANQQQPQEQKQESGGFSLLGENEAGEKTFLGMNGDDIMRFGASMMAAASKPGATTFGAMGQGLQSMDEIRRDEDRKQLEREIAAEKARRDQEYRNQTLNLRERGLESADRYRNARIANMGKKGGGGGNKDEKLIFDMANKLIGTQKPGGGRYTPEDAIPAAQKQLQRLRNPMPEGARQAPDGNYYVPDPDRPGKYLKVNQ